MMMPNGSILVVGGETGSNASPQPSLEILPKPPGGDTVITLDYLQRTDPNNLYPFLMVLPSGRFFIGEAYDIKSARLFMSRALRILQRSSHIRPGDVRYRQRATQHARRGEQLPRGTHVSDGRIGNASSTTCTLHGSDPDSHLWWVDARCWYSTG